MSERTSNPAVQLDPENPWPGLDAFEERARDYFHGRNEEAETLLRRVTDATLTVLFGKSGLGKTSLLKAGLFPRLRQRNFLPVYVRIVLRSDAPPFVTQIGHALRQAFEAENIDAPLLNTDESLWEYFHRRDLELWSTQNFLLTPILVVDQFEELFTLGERLPQEIERFRIDLGDLAENRIPAPVAARIEADPLFASTLNVRAMPYKLIVSLREDFLPELEGWRQAIPLLGRARVRLQPMRADQALSAVYETAPHLMDEALARRIVEFVAVAQTTQTAQGAGSPGDGASPLDGDIEPALLSLFCRGLNEQRKRLKQSRFDEALIEGAKHGIISDHYRSCVEGLPDSVSRFIETELITEKGFRNSYTRDDAVPAHLSAEHLDSLIDRRLLRIEERYGAERIELTHDLLTRAVLEHRTQRRVQESERNRAKQLAEDRARLEAESRRQLARFRIAAIVAVLCLAMAGVAVYQWWRAQNARRESEARNMANQSLVVGSAAPHKALKLAVDAAGLEPSQAETALRIALSRARLRAEVAPPAGVQFRGADISPDGNRVALIRSDEVIEVRELPSLKLLRNRNNGRGGVSIAFFGPRPGDLVVVSKELAVSVWNLEDGSESSLFANTSGTKDWVITVGRPDRLIRHADNRTSLLNLSTRTESRLRPCGYATKPMAAATTENRVLLAFEKSRNTVVCDAVKGEAFRTLETSNYSLGTFSRDGARFLARNMDEEVRIWDVNTATVAATLRGFTAVPSTVAFGGDRDILIGVFDGVLEVRRMGARSLQHDLVIQLMGAQEPVWSAYSVQDGRWILSHHLEGPVRLWKGMNRDAGLKVDFGRSVAHATLSAGGDIMAVYQNGQLARASGGEKPREFGAESISDNPVAVMPSHDRKQVLIGWPDGLVRVWDLSTGKLVSQLKEEYRLSTVAWGSPSCRGGTSGSRRPANNREPESSDCVVTTVGDNGLLRAHSITGDSVSSQNWSIPQQWASGVLSGDGKKWVARGKGETVIIDLAKSTSQPVVHRGLLLGTEWPFTAGGKSVLLKEAFRYCLQDLSDVRARTFLTGHGSGVSSADISPDGTLIVTGSDDWSARLWDAQNGALLGNMRGHMDSVQQVLFRTDGALVATIGRDDTLRVWEPLSGTQLFRFELATKTDDRRILDFDGSHLLIRASDSEVWRVDCEPCLSIGEMQRVARDRLNVEVR